MKWVVLIFLLVVGAAISVDYSPETFSDFDKISANFAEVLSFENTENFFKAKCQKLTGSTEAYNKASVARDVFQTCVQSQINVYEFLRDIENVNRTDTGNLRSVFGKYCRKISTVIACLEDLLSAVDPCLETIEKEYVKILMNMIKSLIDFLCYEDGQRIVEFIADGGFECIEDKLEAIKGCLYEILEKYIPTEVDNFPLLKTVKEDCDNLNTIRTCLITELEECRKSTPANFVDALFDVIEKSANCEN